MIHYGKSHFHHHFLNSTLFNDFEQRGCRREFDNFFNKLEIKFDSLLFQGLPAPDPRVVYECNPTNCAFICLRKSKAGEIRCEGPNTCVCPPPGKDVIDESGFDADDEP